MLEAARLQTAAKVRHAGLASPDERPSKRACAYHEAVAGSSRTSRKAISSRGARPTIHAHRPRVPARHSSSWFRMATHTCRWGLCREAAGRDQRMSIVGGWSARYRDTVLLGFHTDSRFAGGGASSWRWPLQTGRAAQVLLDRQHRSPSPRRTRSPSRAAPHRQGRSHCPARRQGPSCRRAVEG